jgi:ABC-2 type transport system ATP-binding protein
MSAAALLNIHGARRAFGARAALSGVSLALRPGEIYALLGRNGAGKTTLVRAVCGRVRLDAGEVRLAGRDPARDRDVRRRLGLVPQEIALYPDLTARENLEVLGRLAGLTRRESAAKAGSALDWIGLADRAASRVATLSGGMKRRVNLAAGVLHAPDVLLLDEPTVGVDPQARERIHDLLLDLRRRGTALLLTTHDLDQAAALADRVGILDEGQLKAEGTVRELVGHWFGGSRQIALTLREAPDDEAAACLRTLGLAPHAAESRRWSGGVPGGVGGLGGLGDLPALGARLAADGIDALEISLREPDLYSVFFKVTGRELAE